MKGNNKINMNSVDLFLSMEAHSLTLGRLKRCSLDTYQILLDLLFDKYSNMILPQEMKQSAFELIIHAAYEYDTGMEVEPILIRLLQNYQQFNWNHDTLKRFVKMSIDKNMCTALHTALRIHNHDIESEILDYINSSPVRHGLMGIKILGSIDLKLDQNFLDRLTEIVAQHSDHAYSILKHQTIQLAPNIKMNVVARAVNDCEIAARLLLNRSVTLEDDLRILAINHAIKDPLSALALLEQYVNPYFDKTKQISAIKTIINEGSPRIQYELLDQCHSKELVDELKVCTIQSIIQKDISAFDIWALLENYSDKIFDKTLKEDAIYKITQTNSYLCLQLFRSYHDEAFNSELRALALEKITRGTPIQEMVNFLARFGMTCEHNEIYGFSYSDPELRPCNAVDARALRDIVSNPAYTILKEMNDLMNPALRIKLIPTATKYANDAMSLFRTYNDPVFTGYLKHAAIWSAIRDANNATDMLMYYYEDPHFTNTMKTSAIKVVIKHGSLGALHLLYYDHIFTNETLYIKAIKTAAKSYEIAVDMLLYKPHLFLKFPELKTQILNELLRTNTENKANAKIALTNLSDNPSYVPHRKEKFQKGGYKAKEKLEASFKLLLYYHDSDFDYHMKKKCIEACITNSYYALQLLTDYKEPAFSTYLQKNAIITCIKACSTADMFLKLCSIDVIDIVTPDVIIKTIKKIIQKPHDAMEMLIKCSKGTIFNMRLKEEAILKAICDPHLAFVLLSKYSHHKLRPSVEEVFVDNFRAAAIKCAINIGYNAAKLLFEYKDDYVFTYRLKKIAIESVISGDTPKQKQLIINMYCHDKLPNLPYIKPGDICDESDYMEWYPQDEYSTQDIMSNYLLKVLMEYNGNEFTKALKIRALQKLTKDPQSSFELLMSGYDDVIFGNGYKHKAIAQVVQHDKCILIGDNKCIALQLLETYKHQAFSNDYKIQICRKIIECMGYTDDLMQELYNYIGDHEDTLNTNHVAESAPDPELNHMSDMLGEGMILDEN